MKPSRRRPTTQGPHGRQSTRLSKTTTNVLALIFSVVWIFPIYWMVNTALKPRSEVTTSTPLFLPRDLTFGNFSTAFTTPGFLAGLRASAVVTVGSVVVGLAIAVLASAALSRFRFRGRRTIMVAILAVQMLPATALVVPGFLLFNKLHLLNSYIGLILAYVASVIPFSIWVLRGFFLAIPRSLEEAAMTDGASSARILRSILFPLVMPGVVATSVFSFVIAWNDYLIAYVFMQDPSKYTLAVWLNSFSNPIRGTDFGGQMAASVLFALPVVIFFLSIQHRLVAGISAGAVKG
jgi:N,N'-diacetylchitobiose transport system permease protein